jgi:hypothetical protein
MQLIDRTSIIPLIGELSERALSWCVTAVEHPFTGGLRVVCSALDAVLWALPVALIVVGP